MKRKITGVAVALFMVLFSMTGCVARYGYVSPPAERVIIVHHPYRVGGIRYRPHPVRVIYTHPRGHRY